MQCGHTFCAECLRRWFKQCIRTALRVQMTRRNGGLFANAWLRAEELDDSQIADVLQFLRRRTLPYACPTCRQEVTLHPTKVYLLEDIRHSLSGPLGVAQTAEAENDLWTGHFDL